MEGEGIRSAGGFVAWLDGMGRALAGHADAEVPCEGCTACCTSSQFVHIAPDEVGALAHIPAELLFRAPRMPKGHVLLGYDEHGRCPMLVDGTCSIYEHRPRTCRTYDCRVFPAAGVELIDADKAAITERTRQWRFDHPTIADQAAHDEVRAAAVTVTEGAAPATATQHAVAAVELVLSRRRHPH